MQGAKATLASTQYWNLEKGDFDALVSLLKFNKLTFNASW